MRPRRRLAGLVLVRTGCGAAHVIGRAEGPSAARTRLPARVQLVAFEDGGRVDQFLPGIFNLPRRLDAGQWEVDALSRSVGAWRLVVCHGRPASVAPWRSRGLAGQARRLRSAVRARQARQSQLGDVERAERDRLSRLARARAEGVQQRLHERFPRMSVRFAAPVAEVAARPRMDDLATHAGALTYGSFLAIPPLLLFASAVVGFV